MIQVVWVGAVIWSIRVLHIIQVLRSDRQARAIRLVSAARMVGAPGRLGHPDGWGKGAETEPSRSAECPGKGAPGGGGTLCNRRKLTGKIGWVRFFCTAAEFFFALPRDGRKPFQAP